ncbi:MAG: hypothetical protein BIFFINMI_01913 [Phycisphaerae bacterium]|nr:hypothetical protein [Phycisphaerae bacterium]
MRIALVGPELEENLALRCIDAALTAAGHSPRIFDFHAAAQSPQIVRDILAFDPAVVGLSMVFTARAREYVALADALRAAGYRGHVTAGGHFAGFHAAELLRDFPAIDTAIHGEGEEAMVELAADLADPARVAGVSYRDRDGQVVRTPARPTPADLDVRPWPTRPATFHHYLGQPIANILAGRGCYANCHFCSINAWYRENPGQRFRQRDPGCIAAEMAHLYHDRGVRIFNFHDDNFFLPGKSDMLARIDGLADELAARGVGRFAFQVKVRPNDVHPETFDRLAELGLFRVFLGVENAAVDGLRHLGRGVRREQNERALELLAERSIHTCFNLLIFEPQMTADDAQANVDFMRRHAEFPLNFCRVEVYAGTEIERRLRAAGRLMGDYFGYHYRIFDPRMQRAFEMFYRVFAERNFTGPGMNHQAMRADYYYHILRHFWPGRAAGLGPQVKGLVAELNWNNADLLGEIVAHVQADDDGRDDAAVADALLAERVAFDADMLGRMEGIVARMERIAAQPQQSPRRRRLAGPAAAAAAAILLTTIGCKDGVKAPETTERAPTPTGPANPGADKPAPQTQPAPDPFRDPTFETEMAPEPTEMAPLPTQPAPPQTQPQREFPTEDTEMAPAPIQPQPPQMIPLPPTHESEMAPAPAEQSSLAGPPITLVADEQPAPPLRPRGDGFQPAPPHWSEMVAPPVRPHVPPPPPTTQPETPTSQPDGVPTTQPTSQPDEQLLPAAETMRVEGTLRFYTRTRWARLAQQHELNGKTIEVDLRLDETGAVAEVAIRLPEGVDKPAFVKALSDQIRPMRFNQVRRAGTVHTKLTFPKDGPGYEMMEMAPPPRPLPEE